MGRAIRSREPETSGVQPGGELGSRAGRARAFVARTIDVGFALAALSLGSPIMLVVAIIIRLDTPGPAIFRQTRMGRNLRPFTFYKFRTMYDDARERFPELYEYGYTREELQTLRFKIEGDPRLTPVGRWLRKTSLDELPNFVNVLRGDMHLVGPRPEIPEMIPNYLPHQLSKFTVKPGVTGLAQCSGRANLTFQETIAFDLEYVQRRSFGFDVLVFARTVKVLLSHVGAF